MSKVEITKIDGSVETVGGGDELRKVQFEIFRNDNVLARIVRLEAGQSGLEAEVKAIKKQLAAMRAERVQE